MFNFLYTIIIVSDIFFISFMLKIINNRDKIKMYIQANKFLGSKWVFQSNVYFHVFSDAYINYKY